MKTLFSFIAGFFAAPIFHQVALELLWRAGVAPLAPFSVAATRPFGVPAVFSLVFWGGVWGRVFGSVDDHFPANGGYCAGAFLFDAIIPTLVALFVVQPLKSGPIGGGWHARLLLTAVLINGAWGIGTGLILKALFWSNDARHARAFCNGPQRMCQVLSFSDGL